MLSELTPGAVDALIEAAGPGSGTQLMMVALSHLGGAYAIAPEGAGAVADLEGDYALYGVGVPMAPEMVAELDAQLDRLVDAVGPWTTGRSYLPQLRRTPLRRLSPFPEDIYRRLRDAKAEVDPDDLFRSNHPVR